MADKGTTKSENPNLPEMSEENCQPIAKLDFDEAQRLADLGSIFQDLSFVLGTLERLHDLLEQGEDATDPLAVRAYWTAALITYVRCFSTGKRFGLSEEIYEGIEGGIEVHRYYKQLRDKHIAHSVNPFEQVEVGAVLAAPISGERRIEGIAATVFSLISHTTEGVEQLHQLARIARDRTAEKVEAFKAVTRAKADEMDLDSLYERAAEIRHQAPGAEDVSRSRWSTSEKG